MKCKIGHYAEYGVGFGLLLSLASGAFAATQISAKLDTSQLGRTIPPEFVGMSVEMSDVCSAPP